MYNVCVTVNYIIISIISLLLVILGGVIRVDEKWFADNMVTL